MMHYNCHLCKDTGRVFHWSRIFNVPCWKCKKRREQEEKIFAEKIAAIHPPLSLWVTTKPRIKWNGSQWVATSAVYEESSDGGLLVAHLKSEEATPYWAWYYWNVARHNIGAKIK